MVEQDDDDDDDDEYAILIICIIPLADIRYTFQHQCSTSHTATRTHS